MANKFDRIFGKDTLKGAPASMKKEWMAMYESGRTPEEVREHFLNQGKKELAVVNRELEAAPAGTATAPAAEAPAAAQPAAAEAAPAPLVQGEATGLVSEAAPAPKPAPEAKGLTPEQIEALMAGEMEAVASRGAALAADQVPVGMATSGATVATAASGLASEGLQDPQKETLQDELIQRDKYIARTERQIARAEKSREAVTTDEGMQMLDREIDSLKKDVEHWKERRQEALQRDAELATPEETENLLNGRTPEEAVQYYDGEIQKLEAEITNLERAGSRYVDEAKRDLISLQRKRQVVENLMPPEVDNPSETVEPAEGDGGSEDVAESAGDAGEATEVATERVEEALPQGDLASQAANGYLDDFSTGYIFDMDLRFDADQDSVDVQKNAKAEQQTPIMEEEHKSYEVNPIDMEEFDRLRENLKNNQSVLDKLDEMIAEAHDPKSIAKFEAGKADVMRQMDAWRARLQEVTRGKSEEEVLQERAALDAEIASYQESMEARKAANEKLKMNFLERLKTRNGFNSFKRRVKAAVLTVIAAGSMFLTAKGLMNTAEAADVDVDSTSVTMKADEQAPVEDGEHPNLTDIQRQVAEAVEDEETIGNGIKIDRESVLNDPNLQVSAISGAKYDYAEWASPDKISKNAFGTSKEYLFENKDANETANEMFKQAFTQPEVGASIWANIPSVLEAAGLPTDLTAHEIDDIISNRADGGEVQMRLANAFADFLESEDTTLEFTLVSGVRQTQYVTYDQDGTMDPESMTVGYDEKTRDNDMQLTIKHTVRDEAGNIIGVEVSNYTFRCNFQSNIDNTPTTVEYTVTTPEETEETEEETEETEEEEDIEEDTEEDDEEEDTEEDDTEEDDTEEDDTEEDDTEEDDTEEDDDEEDPPVVEDDDNDKEDPPVEDDDDDEEDPPVVEDDDEDEEDPPVEDDDDDEEEDPPVEEDDDEEEDPPVEEDDDDDEEDPPVEEDDDDEEKVKVKDEQSIIENGTHDLEDGELTETGNIDDMTDEEKGSVGDGQINEDEITGDTTGVYEETGDPADKVPENNEETKVENSVTDSSLTEEEQKELDDEIKATEEETERLENPEERPSTPSEIDDFYQQLMGEFGDDGGTGNGSNPYNP